VKRNFAAAVLACSFAWAGGVNAEPTSALPEGYAEDGKDIYVVCAPCHGPEGQGGAHGDYPRLAGLSVEYLVSQLRSFKARERVNIPMYPFTVARELSDQDVLAVSDYITEMNLHSHSPSIGQHCLASLRLPPTQLG